MTTDADRRVEQAGIEEGEGAEGDEEAEGAVMFGSIRTIDRAKECGTIRDADGRTKTFKRTDLVRWGEWDDLEPSTIVLFDDRHGRAINVELPLPVRSQQS